MTNEIVGKLNNFIARHPVFTEECHAVYLLIELRKIIEQENLAHAYRVLQLYADWVVHPRKDRRTESVEAAANAIVAAIEAGMVGGGLSSNPPEYLEFRNMKLLSDDFLHLAKRMHIDDRIVNHPDSWRSLTQLLTAVFADQPIAFKNNLKLEEIRFIPHSGECVVKFRSPINGVDEFVFGPA